MMRVSRRASGVPVKGVVGDVLVVTRWVTFNDAWVGSSDIGPIRRVSTGVPTRRGVSVHRGRQSIPPSRWSRTSPRWGVPIGFQGDAVIVDGISVGSGVPVGSWRWVSIGSGVPISNRIPVTAGIPVDARIPIREWSVDGGMMVPVVVRGVGRWVPSTSGMSVGVTVGETIGVPAGVPREPVATRWSQVVLVVVIVP